MSLNIVILQGNLTRDPELKAIGGGSQVCEFGVAWNGTYTTASGEKRENVCFAECKAWGKTGEIIVKYFTRGKPIIVQGEMRTESWDDKATGKKQSKTRIQVESFHFVGGKKDDDAPRPNMTPTPGKNGGAAPADDLDIPFDHGFTTPA